MSDTCLIIITLCSLAVMLILKKISGSKHSIRAVLLSMLLGLSALTLVNICSVFTGVSMPVSRLSLLCSAVLGIPGVTAMLILQMIL